MVILFDFLPHYMKLCKTKPVFYIFHNCKIAENRLKNEGGNALELTYIMYYLRVTI